MGLGVPKTNECLQPPIISHPKKKQKILGIFDLIYFALDARSSSAISAISSNAWCPHEYRSTDTNGGTW